jgi:hypothetical protein
MDNERIVSTILILGLALVSIRHLPSKPGSVSAKETGVASPSSENKSSVSKAPSSSSASGSNHLAPLRDFLQTQCSQSMEGGERIYDELAKQANIRALVATVPDPIDSSLTHLFDQMVDSIQRAAEGEGYVLDRFYFPWQESVSEKASDSTISKLLPLEPKEQGKPENGHSGKPGLLLFRNPQQIPNGESKVPLLAVFLVGETPTFGIDKIAFACALNEAVKLEKGKEVKILSPCFSGSQTSLALSLRQWVESSGSASLEKITMIGGGSAVSKSGLESCLKNSHPHKENMPPPEISFRSMVISSPLLKRALLAYLWRQNSQYSPNARSDKMVILAESNTSFGSNAGFGKARAEKNQTEDGKDSRIIKEGNWLVTYIPFPLHISEARSAYQRESSQRSEEILYRDAPGSKLRIPTESNKKARDTQPSFAPQMAAAINELSLSALLAAVSRDGYRYVGIIATDERDSIFLARLVREQCPDVQLFTIQPTLAYTHLEYSTFLRGMLVAVLVQRVFSAEFAELTYRC